MSDSTRFSGGSEETLDFPVGREGSRHLYERAKERLPGGVSHNLRRANPYPVYYDRAEGPYKWDVDGNRYLDYGLGAASLMLGHRHPSVVAALGAADLFAVPAACNELEIDWAEVVCELIPTAEQVRFTGSGTEATYLAMRLARAATGRQKVARLEGHYHGWHDYVMVGFRPPYERAASAGVPDGALESVLTLPTTVEDLGAIESRLQERDVACVILEPSGASWGTVPLEAKMLEGLREIATQTGTILIFDEVITAFRWAPGGIQALTGVRPDLTTLAKVLTGGFPGGAVAGGRDILGLLGPDAEPGTGVFHYGTFNAHPVSVVAGIVTLRELASGSAQAAADQHAAELRTEISAALDDLEVAGFVYGESSTFHVYLQAAGWEADPACSLSTTAPDDLLRIPPSLVQAFQRALRSRGVDPISYTGGVVSAAHNSSHLDEAISAYRGALKELRDAGVLAHV